MSGAHPVDWLRQGRLAAVVALTALHLYPIVYFNVQSALGERERRDGRGGRQPGLPRPPPLLEDHAAADPAQRVRRDQHRAHLGLHRAGRPAGVRLHAGDVGADLQRPQGHRPQPVRATRWSRWCWPCRSRCTRGRARSSGGRRRRWSARRRGGASWRPCGAVRRCWRPLGLLAAVGAAALPNLAVVLLALSRDWYGTVLPTGFTLDHFRAAVRQEMVIPSIGNSLRYVGMSVDGGPAAGDGHRLDRGAERLAAGAGAGRGRHAAAGGAGAGDGVRLPGHLAARGGRSPSGTRSATRRRCW